MDSLNAIYLEKLPLVLRVRDLGPILDVSNNTAYALVRNGQIRSVRIGRSYRIPRDAVAEYLMYGADITLDNTGEAKQEEM